MEPALVFSPWAAMPTDADRVTVGSTPEPRERGSINVHVVRINGLDAVVLPRISGILHPPIFLGVSGTEGGSKQQTRVLESSHDGQADKDGIQPKSGRSRVKLKILYDDPATGQKTWQFHDCKSVVFAGGHWIFNQ